MPHVSRAGVSLRYDKSAPEAFSSALSKPTAFAAVDRCVLLYWAMHDCVLSAWYAT